VTSTATRSAMPAVGSPAPDFTLPSTTGAELTLSALRGKNVLIAFFPLAFTRVCTAELCSFSEELGAFETADTVVLPISVDSIPTLREFKAKERISVELLSDFKREVSRRYGTLLEDKFHSNRSYVLIDRNGIVRWTYAEDTTGNRRENGELLERIRALP
jgi:peroxiredoxin